MSTTTYRYDATGDVRAELKLNYADVAITTNTTNQITIDLEGEEAAGTSVKYRFGRLEIKSPDRKALDILHRTRPRLTVRMSLPTTTALECASVASTIELEEVSREAQFDAVSSTVKASSVSAPLSIQGFKVKAELDAVSSPVQVNGAAAKVSIGDFSGALDAKGASITVDIARVHRGDLQVEGLKATCTIAVLPGVHVHTDFDGLASSFNSSLTPRGVPQEGAPVFRVKVGGKRTSLELNEVA
ncbi:DUF4097 family beta strand repeat-containing protein [Dermabacter sp. Marseille-Q3180]|uniref:DUF4097 family beta strand repeat-containing protein n=1 Tax=Dermabacter sp. Marseille-Q3180 TaxID=2758090 RepID=UPI0020258D65|nr:DUF4097 family beta strand repeat-containing protein [Dermabacter sp. Marseille-Q3180]